MPNQLLTAIIVSDMLGERECYAAAPARAAEASLAEFGAFVPMVQPEFADDDGNWLPFVAIAASVWGP